MRNYAIPFLSLSHLLTLFSSNHFVIAIEPVGLIFLSQGKVEYKARPFLATLYSMRYINLYSKEPSSLYLPPRGVWRRERAGLILLPPLFCPPCQVVEG
jgi:hypothetical protein